MHFARSLFLLLTLALGVATPTFSAEGLIAVESPHPAKETMDRLEHVVRERGLSVLGRIDHAAGAAKVGKSLRPTELLIFGNPKGGTPFMECAQSVGIDLPLKAIVWEDADGQVWLAYNDPLYIGTRHGAADCPVIEKLTKALSSIADAAVAD